ncbi:DoxX family protein [Pseudoalteromonas distincta]|uniref:DoxX family protein n=1 Tax=Pseudoalteromonas distincta TaxID=77608 RepID=UPI0039E9D1E7
MNIITIILTLFFTFASSIKIAGWQKFIFETQLSFFERYGLTRTHMLVIGIGELTASITLVISLTTGNLLLNILGGLGIAFVSLGAIFFHIRFDTFKDAIPAFMTLILSSILIILNPTFMKIFI